MKPLRLSLNDIKNAYKGVKAHAVEAFDKGDYERSMEYVRHCATIAQQFNWIYADDKLEDLLKNIAPQIIPQTENDYTPVKDRVVLYDDFCVSFILALQYVDALVAAGKELLYVTFNQQSGKFSSIIPVIQSKYPNVRIVRLEKKSIIQSNIDFYQEIMNFRPEQILLHVFANTIIIPALHALPKVTSKYIINLADQTFWLGAKVVNYVLEFRQFGVSVSQQRRGIKPKQQLLVPFYPIVDNNPFQGFPKECTEEGKVLVFSGGDIYKVLDEKRIYWHLVKRVLDTFPEVVFLFATKIDGIGIDFLNMFIKENHYEGRFIYTKFRPDINEVMAHVDVFMGTCPVCGSLMSQLAARNATPILQYYYPETPDDETEQAICINEEFSISFNDEEAFMQETERLIHDVEYRKKQGKRLQRAMMTEKQFNELVKNTLATNKTQIPLQPYEFDYQQLDDRWFALEKTGYISSLSYLYHLLGAKKCLRYVPILFIKKHLNTLFNYLTNIVR